MNSTETMTSADDLDDLRPGVGLRPDGLPDIEWILVPDKDPITRRREFIYGYDERCAEPDFWMARYPITYLQFQAFSDAADGFHNKRWWQGLAASPQHQANCGEQEFKYWNHPRDHVSWFDAIAFCRWLTVKLQDHLTALPLNLDRQRKWGVTLPTVWQWEKAARGHDARQYPWGGEYRNGYANVREKSNDYSVGPGFLGRTSAVGMFPHSMPFDSLYGIADLRGNVWEWCLNEYDDLPNIQESGDRIRALRGGSWFDRPDHFRLFGIPDFRTDSIGIRAVICGYVRVP